MDPAPVGPARRENPGRSRLLDYLRTTFRPIAFCKIPILTRVMPCSSEAATINRLPGHGSSIYPQRHAEKSLSKAKLASPKKGIAAEQARKDNGA